MEVRTLSTVSKVSMASIKSNVSKAKKTTPKKNPIDEAYERELIHIRQQKADSLLLSKVSPANVMERVKDKIQITINMMKGKK